MVFFYLKFETPFSMYENYWTRNLGGNWGENESFADSARIWRSTNKSGRVVCQRLSELRQRRQTTQGTQHKGKSSKKREINGRKHNFL